MSNIYVISEGGKLNRSNALLSFTRYDGSGLTIRPQKIQTLVLIGKVTLTAEAMRLISMNRMQVLFLSANGDFNSKLVYDESKNTNLRMMQYAFHLNTERCLRISKQIIGAKIRNQIAFIQRIKRKRPECSDKDMNSIVDTCKQKLTAVREAASIEELRGLEGCTARAYFKAIRANIIPEWADFEKRSKNPPKSNVNAVLSFLYPLLRFRVEAAIRAQNLDPMLPIMHAQSYGKSSLSYDLMEEFRAPVADTTCCALFNLGTLCAEDFKTGDQAEDYEHLDPAGIYLTKEGLKKTAAAFEAKMESEAGYQAAIFEQAERLRRVIENAEEDYEPFVFK